MTLLIVTPIHNEERNIPILARQLTSSSVKPHLWVVVDDGSTDDGVAALKSVETDVRMVILERENQGGLIGGSAFSAWQFGVDRGLQMIDHITHVMKLDADVELSSTYLETALSSFDTHETAGLTGGVLADRSDREQTVHVPGPVKLYSKRGYDALQGVPRVVGFDVMDEIALSNAGMDVIVRRDLPFSVRRPIGASQGRIHGRKRNGKVCRWTGYWTPYFFLHVARYAFRKPYIVGAAAMVAGYVAADPGPYDAGLKFAHAQSQKRKLRRALQSPRTWFNEMYGIAK